MFFFKYGDLKLCVNYFKTGLSEYYMHQDLVKKNLSDP